MRRTRSNPYTIGFRFPWAHGLAVLAMLFVASCGTDVNPINQTGPSFTHDGFGTQPPAAGKALLTAGPPWIDVNGGQWFTAYNFKVGTGVINPFLSIQAAGAEDGFNTDASPLPWDDTRPTFTNALPLNVVPIFLEAVPDHGNGPWRELILDANEANSAPDAQFSIDQFDVSLCGPSVNPSTWSAADFVAHIGECTMVYRGVGSWPGNSAPNNIGYLRATDGLTSGSGKTLDYRILIPAANFGSTANNACDYNPAATACGYYVVVFAHMGGAGTVWVTGSTFEEFSTIQRPVQNLTIVKRIVNDNGGTAVVGAFGITTTAGTLTFGSGVADGTNTL